ncbi:hypothetical protein PI124_g13670 [Phytophthora idaei]|nr:hypothetical protein PI124_g13670 [Phytophthora idaei]
MAVRRVGVNTSPRPGWREADQHFKGHRHKRRADGFCCHFGCCRCNAEAPRRGRSSTELVLARGNFICTCEKMARANCTAKRQIVW